MTIEELSKAFDSLGLTDSFPAFRALLRPAIIASATVTKENLPVGSSKFGGTPDLLPDTPWPMVNDHPMKCVAQINLADVTGFDGSPELPKSGLLSFFYYNSFYFEEEAEDIDLDDDSDDDDDDLLGGTLKASKVIYTRDIERVVRTASPTIPFRTARVHFKQSYSPPDLHSEALKSALGLAWKRYRRAQTEVDFEELESHRLLGNSGMDHEIAAQLRNTKISLSYDSDPQWRVLLALQFQMDLWSWGKGGSLYFMIPEEALRSGNFSQVTDYNDFV